MQWPTMSDYQDAMQSPRVSFADPELQRGLPVTDRLGLPRPITGGFASVYQMICGGRKWAVRCFLRHHHDSEQRYAAIGRVLSASSMPYVLGFQYLRQGVRVKNDWYPILKMEWVDGEPLNTYVQKHISNPQVIRDLAHSFADMSRDLRSRSIAHGDLQHGNILVVGGRLKLVDYDGMYVPGLNGLPSHEVGHPNYQHPSRSEGDFGPYLDAFSEWVIYVSLTALSVRPDLWDILKIGDEQLLFSQRDFLNPAGSKALRAMDESGDPVLKGLSSTFRHVIMVGDVSRISPPDVAADPSKSLSPQGTAGASGGRVGALAKKLWLPLSGSQGKPAPIAVNVREASSEGPTPVVVVQSAATTPPVSGSHVLPQWVAGHLPAAAVKLSPPFRADRAFVASYAALVFGLFRFHAAGYLSAQIALWSGVGGCAGITAILVWRFVTRPEFQKKKGLVRDLKDVKRRAKKVESKVKGLEREKSRIQVREKTSVDNIQSRLTGLAKQERDEHAQVDLWLQTRLAEITVKREELNKAEADELSQAAKGIALPFLGKTASSILKRYRTRRDPLLRQEQKTRLDAQKSKDSIRSRYIRVEQVFRNKLAEVKTNYGKDIGALDSQIAAANSQLSVYREDESNLGRELKLYSEVNFGVYLRRVAYLP